MDITSLFTPEVMERMFSVLETAAEGSVAVLIIYLLIPLLSAVISCGAVVWGISIVCKCLIGMVKGSTFKTKYNGVDCVNKSVADALDVQVERIKGTYDDLLITDVKRLTRILDNWESSGNRLRG